MFRIGQAEIDAVTAVIHSGKMFRYTEGGQCEQFEKRFAEYLGARHVRLTSSGTTALTAALGGLGIGPGDEVIVPAHTYMATAMAVVAVGAIPVIVDIDESITLSPEAVAAAVGPRTRALIAVHMWGVVADMGALGRVARRHKLLVVEDACQCIGGQYKGRMVGSIGHAGAFSFNYYKNISCGEGGAVVTRDAASARRAACMIDPCSFFWSGRQADAKGFCANGSRPSEFEGAILGAQFKRLPGILRALRRIKRRILDRTADCGLIPAPSHSPDGECATGVIYQLPTAEAAQGFNKLVGGQVLANTGRHTYTEWDPILTKSGGHHPAMNPFTFAANAKCRMDYRKDLCPRSLEILGRSVMIGLHPDRTGPEVTALIKTIRSAAGSVLGS